jgi:hypothetical protein
MYNNITKFINPKYATLFLIVLGGILLALFMNSRLREGYTNKEINNKLGAKLNEKDLDRKVKNTSTIKTINSDINNIKTNKLDSKSSVITTLQNDVKNKLGPDSIVITGLRNDLNNKLGDKSTTITDLQSKLTYNTNDIVNLTTNVQNLNNNKLDISSSVITDLQAGIKTKLDASVFDSTMKNVPTGNTISEMVDGKINSKAGDINAAKDQFEKNAATKTTSFDANAAAKTATFNDTVVAQTSSFNSNADTQRNAFNGLFDNKYGTFDSYAKSTTNTLGSMKDASVSAAERAEAALNQSIQIQNNIFGASSEKMITQANQYNTNDAMKTMDPSFNRVKEGLVNQDDILGKETNVKTAITAYKTAVQNYNNNQSDANLTLLLTASSDLDTKTQELTLAYSQPEQDQTASIKEKASAIDNLRRELDTKMQQVLNKQDITNQYDSTVYTGIMWSVLGTSLLYYIFTEM